MASAASIPITTPAQLLHVQRCLRHLLTPLGLDIAFFRIGDYNAEIAEPHRLDHNNDSIAFSVIGTARSFNQAKQWFVSGAKSRPPPTAITLFDSFAREQVERVFASAASDLGGVAIVRYYSPDETESATDEQRAAGKQPRYLFSGGTVGHVSGQAFYLHSTMVAPQLAPESIENLKVSVSAHYGGYFGYRCFLVTNAVLKMDEEVYKKRLKPRPVLPPPLEFDAGRVAQLNLLMLTSFSDQNKWRAVCCADPLLVYSPEAQAFFDTPIQNRQSIINRWLQPQESKASGNDTQDKLDWIDVLVEPAATPRLRVRVEGPTTIQRVLELCATLPLSTPFTFSQRFIPDFGYVVDAVNGVAPHPLISWQLWRSGSLLYAGIETETAVPGDILSLRFVPLSD